MKKRFLIGMGITGVALVTGFHVNLGIKKNNSFDVKLENVESLAVCEVSSNPSNNKGICAPVLGGGDSCVALIFGGPACSGNI